MTYYMYKAVLYKLYFNILFHIWELESTPKFLINNEQLRDSVIPMKKYFP